MCDNILEELLDFVRRLPITADEQYVIPGDALLFQVREDYSREPYGHKFIVRSGVRVLKDRFLLEWSVRNEWVNYKVCSEDCYTEEELAIQERNRRNEQDNKTEAVP